MQPHGSIRSGLVLIQFQITSRSPPDPYPPLPPSRARATGAGPPDRDYLQNAWMIWP